MTYTLDELLKMDSRSVEVAFKQDLYWTAIYWARLANKYKQLVQEHADKSDQEMCWENDVELYEKMNIRYNKDKLPKNYEEHKRNCDKYRCGLGLKQEIFDIYEIYTNSCD